MAHTSSLISQLTIGDVEALDTYTFLAVIGKRVIHPGGRRSTDWLLAHADFQPGQLVLDVGCGVGTTAIEVARRFGLHVTAVDISPIMLDLARANVRAAGLEARLSVESGNILALHFPDHSFDRVLAEAVTFMVDRQRAARELLRVCRSGGRVLATELVWQRPPTAEARAVFQGEVCPGHQLDSAEAWDEVYRAAGLQEIQIATGPFEIMTPAGFNRDEGLGNIAAMMARTFSRWTYLKKMAWLMPRMMRAVPYLGYVAMTGVKASEVR